MRRCGPARTLRWCCSIGTGSLSATAYEGPLVPPYGIDAVWMQGDLVQHEGRIHPPKTFAGRHLLTPPAA